MSEDYSSLLNKYQVRIKVHFFLKSISSFFRYNKRERYLNLFHFRYTRPRLFNESLNKERLRHELVYETQITCGNKPANRLLPFCCV